jgi:hypothetical protein
VAARTEVVADGAERSQKPLGVVRGFEALKHPLAFAGRQVRILRTVVQTLVAPMFSVRQHSANRWWVAGQLIGDDDARLVADAIDKLPKETLRGILISTLLHQDVQHDAVLINRPPQPVALAADFERHLVQMPLVTSACTPTTESRGVARAELRAPGPDRLMADDDAALGEQVLNVTAAEVETKVQSHGVSDNLAREAVTAIGRPLSWLGDRHQARLIADPHST